MDEVGPRQDNILSVVYYEDGAVSVTLGSQKAASEKYVDRDAFKLDFLKAHNNYRSKHGVPRLELDDKICDYAQKRSERLAAKNKLERNQCSCYGENMMCIYATDPDFVLSPNFPVDTWYEEKKYYRFGAEPQNLSSSHFSQMVWKDSTVLGVGWAKSKQGITYVVANYDPPGNEIGCYIENVSNVLSEEEVHMVSDEHLPTLPELLQTPPTGRKPRRKRFLETPDSVIKAKMLAQELVEQIENVKDDPHADVHSAVKESKQKAEEMVEIIDRIKSVGEYVRDVTYLGATKQNMLDMTQTLEALEATNMEVEGDEDVFDKVTEAQQAVHELTEDLEELEIERERVEQIPLVVDEARDNVKQLIHAFQEIESKTGSKMHTSLNKAYQKGQDVVRAVEKIEEEQQHVTRIPEVVDKAKVAVEELSGTIDKIKERGESSTHGDVRAAASKTLSDAIRRVSHTHVENEDELSKHKKVQRTPIDDVRLRVREMVKAIEKLEKDEKIKVLKKPKKMQNHDFVRECLDAHNEYREKHKVPPLKLNSELTKISQAWANKLLNEDVVRINPEKKYGENVYLAESRDPTHTITGYEAVDSWYQEVDKYRFGVEPYDLECGHFTQVVWKGTTDLGVGVAAKDGNIFVVCNYDKPGNVLGQFTKNVPPVGGFSQESNRSKKVESTPKVTLQESSTYLEENFVENFLKAHNRYRKEHGVPPLSLDKNLNAYAQEWANTLAEKDKLEIRTSSPYGGNYYSVYSSDPHYKLKGHVPVDSWYDEKKYWEFGKEPDLSRCSDFTQVIWRSTKFLGVGIAKADKGKIFVVANYKPAGNRAGEFHKNLPDVVDKTALKASEDTSDKASLNKYESDGVFTPFQFHGLNIHNEYRQKHGVPPLKLNKHLCDFAKEWAEENLRLNMMYHRPNNEYGENIYTMSSTDYAQVPSARDAVKAWYAEIEEYEFDNENINWETLHFTQVIWKDTKEVGIGIATDKGNSYIVANYRPRGNVRNQFITNVPRPLQGPYAQKQSD